MLLTNNLWVTLPGPLIGGWGHVIHLNNKQKWGESRRTSNCLGKTLLNPLPLPEWSSMFTVAIASLLCVPEYWNRLNSLPTSDGHILCTKKISLFSFLDFRAVCYRNFFHIFSVPHWRLGILLGLGEGSYSGPPPPSQPNVPLLLPYFLCSQVTEALQFPQPIWVFPSCFHAPAGFDLEEWGKEQALRPTFRLSSLNPKVSSQPKRTFTSFLCDGKTYFDIICCLLPMASSCHPAMLWLVL